MTYLSSSAPLNTSIEALKKVFSQKSSWNPAGVDFTAALRYEARREAWWLLLCNYMVLLWSRCRALSQVKQYPPPLIKAFTTSLLRKWSKGKMTFMKVTVIRATALLQLGLNNAITRGSVRIVNTDSHLYFPPFQFFTLQYGEWHCGVQRPHIHRDCSADETLHRETLSFEDGSADCR